MPALRLIAIVSNLLPAFVLLCSSAATAEETSFYLVWGTEGNWDGSVELQDGRLIEVKPFRFEANRGDRIVSTDEHRAVWQSSSKQRPRHPRVRRIGTAQRSELQDAQRRAVNQGRRYSSGRQAGQTVSLVRR